MFEALVSRLHDEIRRLWLYRWFLVGLSLITFVVIAGVAVSLPKRYDAWSEVYVDKQAAMSAATQDVALNGAATPSSVMINPKVLLNDDKLQAVLIKIDPETASLSPVEMAKAVVEFRKTITITAVDDDGFLQFHCKDVDPVRATRVVQELTRQFIDISLVRTQNDLNETTKFLDGQIESFKGLMAASQQQLANFRQAHPGLPLQGGVMGGSVAPAEDTVVTVAAPGAVLAAAPVAPVAPRVFPEDQRIGVLEAQLANLQLQYTDQHPDVVNTRRELAQLLRSRAAAAAVAPVVSAPVATLAAATDGRRYTQVVRGRGRPAVVPPDVAAEWGTVLGNDAMLRADYQQLINKQQAVKMSAAILESSKRFLVIRPATVPRVSYMPPRSWLVGGALVVALMIGLVVTFLRAAISGVLVSPRELEEEFDLPVAGTVSWEPAWQTGQVQKVDPRFIPPFLRPRIASHSQQHRLVGPGPSL